MNRGQNDLLDECHKRLAYESNRIDWIITAVCFVAIAVVWGWL